MSEHRKKYVKQIKRIVVKIGTSTLTHSTGLLNLNRIEHLVRQAANIHNQDIQISIVSSGAIGAGMGKLGIKKKPKTIPENQAAASVGQGILLHMYEKLFSEYGKTVAQILLTKEDLANRTRFLNARNALFNLFSLNVIPIINENDAVGIDEIKFGDNDTLAALVTHLIDADMLIILTDIDGLYDSSPVKNSNAKLIKYVDKITDKIKSYAGDPSTKFGTGGMITKIKAAEIAMTSGSSTVIANGSTPDVLNLVLEGKDIGTFFQENKKTLQSRKCWIAYNTKLKGHIIVDNGAKRAIIQNHKSLLPVGIKSTHGSFQKGDVISILDTDNNEFARGITNYESSDIKLIKGKQTSDIKQNLGYKNYDEVVHTNNLVILKDNTDK